MQRFNESFYAALATGASTAARAVADAQANLRAASSDPWLWAPHVLFGDWR